MLCLCSTLSIASNLKQPNKVIYVSDVLNVKICAHIRWGVLTAHGSHIVTVSMYSSNLNMTTAVFGQPEIIYAIS